ncbi:MAG: hypothetical protein FIA94_03890 [Nitrospirae bacterium]|nr:hypothetical protein [Nitrospirota bacterium]
MPVHRRSTRGSLTYLVFPFIIGITAILLQGLYHVPLGDTMYWGVGLFICFFVPGSLILGWLGNHGQDRVMNAVHATALGTALMPLPYIIFQRVGAPSLILFFFLGTLLLWMMPKVFAVIRKKEAVQSVQPAEASWATIGHFAVLLAVILALLHVSHFTDVRFRPDGFGIRTLDASETDFHLGIVNALRDSFPPAFPYASGAKFGHYHVAMHLQIEMFHRLFGLDTLRLSYFHFPLLYFFLLVAISFSFVRNITKSTSLAYLIAVLIFGSDLSFVPGMLGAFAGRPWTVIFQTTIWSLLTLNGQLPALVVLVLMMMHLQRYGDHGSSRDLALFAILGYAALGFKSSMGLHAAAAALLTGLLLSLRTETRKKGVGLAAVSAVLLAAVIADVFLLRGGTSNVRMTFAPFNIYGLSLKKIGIAPKGWGSHALFFLAYIIGTFGARVPGLWQARQIFSRRPDPVSLFLVIVVLSGFALSEMMNITIFFGNVNNAMWFSATSLMVAWFLLILTLSQIRERKVLFAVSAVVVLLLSLPSTVQFLTLRYDRHYIEFRKEDLEVIRILDRAPSGSVILHPLNQTEPSLAANFTGQQAVLSFYRSLGMMPLAEDDFLKRVRDVVLFFDPQSTIDRAAILKRYGVTLVYAPLPFAAFLDKEPMLLPVLRNRLYVLYKVTMPQ